MTIFTVFTLAGIALCISRHRGWGAFCFFIAIASLLYVGLSAETKRL